MPGRVRQRVHGAIHEIALGRCELGVLTAARVDPECLPSEHRRDIVGVEPGAVHDGRGRDAFMRRADGQPFAVLFTSNRGASDHQHDVACVAQVLERADERLGLDDAGRSRPERRCRPHMRLAGLDEVGVDHCELLDVVGDSSRVQRLELSGVAGRGRGDDQLAGANVGHVVARAEFVHQAPAFDTELRFQRAGRIVDAGMNDAAVVGAGVQARLAVAFEEADRAALLGNLRGAREAHDSRTNDDDVNF